MERVVKPLLDSHMQVLLLELLAALKLLRYCILCYSEQTRWLRTTRLQPAHLSGSMLCLPKHRSSTLNKAP